MSTINHTSALLDTKRAEGIIEPARLAANTVLFLETNTQTYEVIIREGATFWITGVGKRGFLRRPGVFVGSMTSTGALLEGVIAKDCHLVFDFAGERFVSGCVRAANVRGSNYNYEMWVTNDLYDCV